MTQHLPLQPRSRSYGRRSTGAVALALALCAGGLAVAGPASATAQPSSYRIAGADRFDTSAEVSSNMYGDGEVSHVVIASGLNFPDGLSAAAYAGAVGGPLITVPKDGLVPDSTLAELARVGATTATIIGGPSAVSTDIEHDLTAHGLTVDRIAGADRYSTSALVTAATADASTLGSYKGLRTAFLATGQGFADALAASAPAYSDILPVLLTAPDALGSTTASALTDGGFQQVIIMGGTSAVSAAVADAVSAMDITVIRVSGADRFQTAAALADRLIDPAGLQYDNSYVTVVSGTDFADALSAGPYSGYYFQPLLFAEGSATDDWIRAHSATIDSVEVVGGTARISDARLDQLIEDATTA